MGLAEVQGCMGTGASTHEPSTVIVKALCSRYQFKTKADPISPEAAASRRRNGRRISGLAFKGLTRPLDLEASFLRRQGLLHKGRQDQVCDLMTLQHVRRKKQRSGYKCTSRQFHRGSQTDEP